MFPVSVQSRDDMGLVLILVTADYHQTVVCGGGRGESERGVRRRGGVERSEEILFKVS